MFPVPKIKPMAWLEAHQTLERHPKTSALADLMGWSIDETIGKLFRFWFWVLDFAPSGDLRKFNDATLGRSVGLSGDAAKQFVESMVAACWLDRSDDVFRVHNWLKYAGRYLRDSLFKRDPARWQESLAVYGLSADCLPTNRRQSAVTVPNRTLPNLTIDKEGGLPPDADRKRFEKPLRDEMLSYGLTLTPPLPATEVDKCFDYYESNGWRVGQKPMKNWQAAMRNWHRNYESRKYEQSPNGRRYSPPVNQRNVGVCDGAGNNYGEAAKRRAAQAQAGVVRQVAQNTNAGKPAS